jgi:uncharacterized protein (TIGR02757 family)
MNKPELKQFLDEAVRRNNQIGFIESDPIAIPHGFSSLQDIEIMGFWVAVLAWGQRKTIINKALELIELMDGAPYDFVLNHRPEERERLAFFKHRTFNAVDTEYFLTFLQHYYLKNESLESAFTRFLTPNSPDTSEALIGFHELFFSLPEAPQRTRKHLPTPLRNSTCKRINMFLRWMVRKDECGVDFGCWNKISPAQLLMPLDVHVDRIARRLGLLERKQSDWQAVLELTESLRQFDPSDPVKYDFALFGLGIEERWGA